MVANNIMKYNSGSMLAAVNAGTDSLLAKLYTTSLAAERQLYMEEYMLQHLERIWNAARS